MGRGLRFGVAHCNGEARLRCYILLGLVLPPPPAMGVLFFFGHVAGDVAATPDERGAPSN